MATFFSRALVILYFFVHAPKNSGARTQTDRSSVFLSNPGQDNADTIWSSVIRNIFDRKNESIDPCDDFYTHICGDYIVADADFQQTKAERNNQEYAKVLRAVENGFKYQRADWFRKVGLVVEKCSQAVATSSLPRYCVNYDEFLHRYQTEMSGLSKNENVTLEEYAGHLFRLTSVPTLFGEPKAHGWKGDLSLDYQAVLAGPKITVLETPTIKNLIHMNSLATLGNTAADFEVNQLLNIQEEFQSIVETIIDDVPIHMPADSFKIEKFIEASGSSTENFRKLSANFGQNNNLKFWSRLRSLVDTYGNTAMKNFILVKTVLTYTAPYPSEEDCLRFLLLDQMDLAAARLVIDDYLKPSAQIDLITIHSFVKRAFRRYITKYPGLDSGSKRYLLNKLNAMHMKLGWPKWILNDLALDDWYKKLDLNSSDNVCDIKTKLYNFKAQSEAARERDSFMNTLIFEKPLMQQRAYYIGATNYYSVNLAWLKPPRYFPNAPAVLNFASVGHTIGHEIAHAFGRNKRHWDYSGNIRRPCIKYMAEEKHISAQGRQERRLCRRNEFGMKLSEDASADFKNMEDCLAHYYNDSRCLSNGFCVNGSQTLKENESDILGLKMAYAGYKMWVEEIGKRVDELKTQSTTASDENVFFSAFARSWCGELDDSTVWKYRYYPHSPYPYRVNMPLGLVPEFKTVFKCPEGSVLAPTRNNSCAFWY